MKRYNQIRCAYSSVSCNECPEKMKKDCSTLAEFHRIILLPEVKPILVKENQLEQQIRSAELAEQRKIEEEKKKATEAKDKKTTPTVPSP